VAGRIVASNGELAERPELLNHDPYGAGWLMRLQRDPSAPGDALLSAAEYAQFLDAAE
jgi:glycine cleavage system H protein